MVFNLLLLNPVFAQIPVSNQPANGTYQWYCLQYKDAIGASEENCNKMFDGNTVKTAGGWVFLCNLSKIALDQLPAVIRFGAHFLPCTPDPVSQLTKEIDGVSKAFNGIFK